MTTQDEFDAKYITTSEIEARFGVSRYKLCRNRDILPGAVRIANVFVYVREIAEPALIAMQGDKRRRS